MECSLVGGMACSDTCNCGVDLGALKIDTGSNEGRNGRGENERGDSLGNDLNSTAGTLLLLGIRSESNSQRVGRDGAVLGDGDVHEGWNLVALGEGTASRVRSVRAMARVCCTASIGTNSWAVGGDGLGAAVLPDVVRVLISQSSK